MGPTPRRLAAAALALLLTVALCGGARAHAVLLESSPASDAVLAEGPGQAVLRFNEPVRPVVVRLLRAADASDVELGAPEALDGEIRIALPATLPGGSYLLSYRVTSADGHPVAGSFVFAIGAAGETGAGALTAPGGSDGFWRAAGVAARALWYGALLLASGLALFLALMPVPAELAPPLRRALPWLGLAGMAGGLAMLGASGGALLGDPPGALLTAAPWRIALASPVATSVAIAIAGLAVLVLGGRLAFGPQRAWLLAGALLIAASFGAAGHAATSGPRWITWPTLALHAACAAYWVGAFAPLLLALRRLPRAEALDLVRAFSRLAIPGVACLLLAGILVSALQLRAPSALIATDYGRILLLKLALVSALLGLAAVNRRILTPALERGERGARWLRRSIGTDLAAAAGVVLLTAALGAVPPPRALAEPGAQDHASHAAGDHASHAAGDHASHHPEVHAEHAGRDYAVHAAAGGNNLVLVASPATVGDSRLDLYVTDGENRPVDAQSATISLSLPARGIEPLRIDARTVAPGHFRASSLLAAAGTWQVEVELLIDDFTKLAFRTRIAVEE